MTEAEKRLWMRLRGRQLNQRRFLRQYSIGSYVVDFYCPKEKLVIELDGGQHSETGVVKYVKQRSDCLSSLGIGVIRFWDN